MPAERGVPYAIWSGGFDVHLGFDAITARRCTRICRAVKHVAFIGRVAGPPLNPRAVRGTRVFARWQMLTSMLRFGDPGNFPAWTSASASPSPFPVATDAIAGDGPEKGPALLEDAAALTAPTPAGRTVQASALSMVTPATPLALASRSANPTTALTTSATAI